MRLKILGLKGEAIHGGKGTWHLPHDGQPGDWMPTVPDPVPCERGYHLVTHDQAMPWLRREATVWEAEGRGAHVGQADKSVWAKARLIRKLLWSPQIAALFAADCAERVLPLFEQQYPQDDRPRKAIEAARAWAHGELTTAASASAADAADAAYAAYAAASAAASAAAYASASAASASASASAASASASASAASAAYAASASAAYAAYAAASAYAAAYAAASASAASASAASAARKTEITWQAARLLDYLEGRPPQVQNEEPKP